MAETARSPYVGQSVVRQEDIPVVKGEAKYVADLVLPRMLYGKVLRSPYAHARVKRIDVERAKRLKGVVTVLTGRDIVERADYWGHLPIGFPPGTGDQFPLCLDKVRYVGDEVAFVAAEDRYTAQDALELIQVEYEELPVLMEPEQAMAPGAPILHERVVEKAGIQGNVYFHYKLRTGDIEAAVKEADLVVKDRFVINRPVCGAMETHGSLVTYDRSTGKLTIYTCTQALILVRDVMAAILRIPANRIKVVAPNVGGAFGSKADVFPYDVLAAIASMDTGRPVKVVLDRGEVFQMGTGRKSQVRHSELYLKKDGAFLGWREKVIQDEGAHATWGNQILQIGTQIGLLPYKFPNVWVDGYCVYTNKAPGCPVRGFGTPQTIFAKESLIDMAAASLKMDPVEIRLKNLVRGDECPYTTSLKQEVDSTSIDLCLKKAAEVSGWAEKRKKKVPYRGIGAACVMKYSSCRHPSLDTDMDSVRVRMETDGTVTVYSSACPHGQGIETTLAQICADELGVDIASIRVVTRDSELVPIGLGTWGSRSAVISGSALRKAAHRVKEKLFKITAHILEADPNDLVAEGGRVFVRGTPDRGISLFELSIFSHYVTHLLPPGVEPGPIEETACYDSPTVQTDANGLGNMSVTYSAAAHVAQVEVDPETGKVRVSDYVVASDHGTVINPGIVEGQDQGALAMGLGMALWEDLIYDEKGQLLNGSFRDYSMPLASDLPSLTKLFSIPAPSTVVPGGVKSAGESGTPPVPAAIANAVYDAIGVRFTSLPITPEKVLMALKAKGAA